MQVQPWHLAWLHPRSSARLFAKHAALKSSKADVALLRSYELGLAPIAIGLAPPARTADSIAILPASPSWFCRGGRRRSFFLRGLPLSAFSKPQEEELAAQAEMASTREATDESKKRMERRKRHGEREESTLAAEVEEEELAEVAAQKENDGNLQT